MVSVWFFIHVNLINNILHGHLGIRNFSSPVFQHSNFRISGGYVISCISLFLNGEIVSPLARMALLPLMNIMLIVSVMVKVTLWLP